MNRYHRQVFFLPERKTSYELLRTREYSIHGVASYLMRRKSYPQRSRLVIKDASEGLLEPRVGVCAASSFAGYYILLIFARRGKHSKFTTVCMALIEASWAMRIEEHVHARIRDVRDSSPFCSFPLNLCSVLHRLRAVCLKKRKRANTDLVRSSSGNFFPRFAFRKIALGEALRRIARSARTKGSGER